MKSGLVDSPERYEWSSYQAYQTKKIQYDWIYKKYVFEMLGLKENYKSKQYLGAISIDATNEIYDFFSKGNLRSILGSQQFREQTKNRVYGGFIDPEIPEIRDFLPEFKTIVAHVSRELKISVKEIKKLQRGSRNLGLDLAIYLCRQITQCKLTEIGNYFNNRKYGAISSAVNRIKTQINENQELANLIKRLTLEINNSQIEI